FVYKYRPLFTGRNRISSDWAFLYRLANYLIATVVGFGFMAAIPTRNLGHITTFGSRTLQVYLWHILLQSILITSGVWDTVFGVNAYMKVVWLLIPIPLTLFLSLKIFRQPTDFLMKAPRGLSKKQETK
ncbi:MAG: hypothetical protein J6Z00_04825, partial [Clostridia bacterium]|nr:hypothetical protein [Clostridia bacterium]